MCLTSDGEDIYMVGILDMDSLGSIERYLRHC